LVFLEFFGGQISAHLVAKVWPIWRPNFGPFSGRFQPICWPNLGQFGGRSSAHLAAEVQKSSFLFWPLLVLFSALFSDFWNRPSFGLPYRNKNVPEIPDRYFRVSVPIFAKIHRTSKMLPKRIALTHTRKKVTQTQKLWQESKKHTITHVPRNAQKNDRQRWGRIHHRLAFTIRPRKAMSFWNTMLALWSFFKTCYFFPIRPRAKFVRSPVVYGYTHTKIEREG
jgi:hypothetical protein